MDKHPHTEKKGEASNGLWGLERGGWRVSAAAKSIKLWFTRLWQTVYPPHRVIVSARSQDFKKITFGFPNLSNAHNFMEPKSSVFSKVTPHTHMHNTSLVNFPCWDVCVYPVGVGHSGRSTRNTETQAPLLPKSDMVTSVAIFSD